MKYLAVAVFLVAVAYANAGIGLPLVASRGALEGALGGQWIPDVPVAAAPVAAPLVAAPVLSAHAYAAPLVAAPVLGAPVLSRGDLEGALGGQWVPDVLPGH